ncbi:unnamed protein product [Phytophthora lilii]|uniref:Unnamed protein product n=1 Tax=Phytophthora lilii TaxID=2077276 RepID=A0A9W6WKH6_9STRA|nr:unnamed protein product [Phytophthora lilii]
MTRSIFLVLATVALMTSGAVAALDNGVVLSETFGGPRGKEYSDLDISKPGQDVKSITVQAGERVNGLGLVVRDAKGVESEVFHCGRGGSPNTLTLGDGEFITGMEAHYGEKDDHTRIKYISSSPTGTTPSRAVTPTRR